ncbi:MAG: GAF domain-containing protein, partial [Dehalococcoidia bacterium]
MSASPSSHMDGSSKAWLPALIQVMARVNAAATGPGIFDALAQGVVQEFGIPMAAVWAHDPAGNTLHLRATAGLSGYRERAPATLSPGDLDLEIVRVSMTGEAEIIKDIGADGAYRNPAWLLAHGIRAYAALPLTLDGEGCGAISVFYREEWPPVLLDALHALAHQAALAIEHARLIEESHALQAIAAEVAASPNYRDLLQGLVQRTRATLGADGCAGWLLDEHDILQVEASDGLSATFLRRAARPAARARPALFEEVARTRLPLYTRDDQAVARARSPELAALLADEGIVCALRLPLFEAGGRVVGMIGLYHHRERRYSESEVRLAQAFTDQIAVALHNVRLAENERAAQAAAKRQLERLQTITRITERLLAAPELSAVLRVVVEAAARLCGGTGAMVGLLDDSGDRFMTMAAEGVSREYFEHFTDRGTDDGFLPSREIHTAPTATQQALQQRAAVVVE